MSDTKSGFSIERRGLELRFRNVTLSAREWLAPDFVRVRLTGSDLAGLKPLLPVFRSYGPLPLVRFLPD